MNIDTLQKIARFKGLSQSQIADAADVSRQAVSLWFGQSPAFVPIGTDHLLNLSKGLGVKADSLLYEIADRDWWERETVNLLWDKLFPDLTEFLSALDAGDLKAIARLVEIYGLFASSKIAGKNVWSRFNHYKNYLPPVRRKELEQLWNTQKSLRLI
jgi:transcriptional regulator with XRE-family HTH domain